MLGHEPTMDGLEQDIEIAEEYVLMRIVGKVGLCQR
jgi:hypothetical protein